MFNMETNDEALNNTNNTKPLLHIDDDHLKKIYKKAKQERNELLHYDGYKIQAKVCCICDQFIRYDCCQPISLDWLLDKNVSKCLTLSKDDWRKFM